MRELSINEFNKATPSFLAADGQDNSFVVAPWQWEMATASS
jgi:hypothetical protein